MNRLPVKITIIVFLLSQCSVGALAQSISGNADPESLIRQAEKLTNEKKYKESSALLEKVLDNYYSTGYSTCQIPDLQLKVLDNYYREERWKEARAYARRSIESFEKGDCRDTSLLVELLLFEYDFLSRLDSYKESLQPLMHTLEICNTTNNSLQSKLPRIYQRLANVHGDLGANFQALEYAEKAMDVRRKLFRPDQIDYIKGWYDVANFAERTGDYERAYRNLDSIISSPFADQYSYLPNSYHLLSLVCIRREEYDIARRYASIALNRFDQKFGKDNLMSSFAYQELGSALLGLGEVEASVHSYERAYEIRNLRYGPDHRLTLSSLSSLSRAKMAMGDTLSSIDAYKEIVNKFSKNYAIDQADKYVSNILKIGELYQGAGIQDSANAYYLKGYELVQQHYRAKDRVHVQANSYLSSISPLKERRKYTMGAKYHLTGDSSLQSLTREDMAFATDHYSVLNVYHLHAKNLFENFKNSGELSYLEELSGLGPEFDLIKDEIFRQFLSIKSIIRAAPLVREISLLRLRANHILYQQEQKSAYLDAMLQAIEESKNLALQVQLFEKNLKTVLGLPDSLLQLENQLYLEINQLNAELSKSQDPELEKQKLELERRYFDIRRNVLLQSDKYHRAVSNEKLTVREVQKKLSRDQMILDYFLDEGELYLLFISRDQSGLVKSRFETEDEKRLEDYIRFSNSLPEEGAENHWKEAYQLYTQLIPTQLPDQIKKLIIIPDNKLYLIPFDILISEIPVSSAGISQLEFLVKRFEISYMSGLRHHQLKRSKKRAKKALAFAPFDQEEVPGNTMLPVLRFSDDELESIGYYFPLDGHTGKEATEELFKKLAKDYRIIHVASHALVDKDKPLQSNILFYPSGSTEDGKLELWELYTLDIPAELAILSACQTSDGDLVRGAGLMNIARGFYTAGTQKVISNLWPVQDYAASQFMRPFYETYKRTGNAPEALREAKLHYLREQSGPLLHPMYWAGWIVQQSELPAPSIPLGIELLGAALLFIVIVTIFWFWWKRGDGEE